MTAHSSATAKGAVTLRKDWQDLKSDLQRWTRFERVSAGFITFAMAGLPVTLAVFGLG